MPSPSHTASPGRDSRNSHATAGSTANARLTPTSQPAGASPAAVCVEVPAGELALPSSRLVAALEELSRSGILLAVRRAGTGGASPAALASLPLSALLLDPELDADAVRAVVALAHALELSVVASRVETWEALERARDLGCDIAEGAVGERLGGPLEIGA